eukprot:7087507-Ditylum_brightwellii.AAC.1
MNLSSGYSIWPFHTFSCKNLSLMDSSACHLSAPENCCIIEAKAPLPSLICWNDLRVEAY